MLVAILRQEAAPFTLLPPAELGADQEPAMLIPHPVISSHPRNCGDAI